MTSFGHFEEPWINAVKSLSSGCSTDFPSYPRCEPQSLICTSRPVSFEIGTGASIYTNSLLPAIIKAKHEVILVTCFWARSSTLTALGETLQQLAILRKNHIHSQRQTDLTGTNILPPLDIHICFSSRSFFQKVFHPCSRDGYTYHPSKWVSKLGLPDPEILEAGLINLRVKSLFFFPFSVMHPKFLIVDRQRAWLSSCNVSWESWLEGCVEITGDAVYGLLRFYHSVWDRNLEADGRPPITGGPQHLLDGISNPGVLDLTVIQSPARRLVMLRQATVRTILLPSTHHRNPQFRPFPWQQSPPPPATPLNCAIMRLIDIAEKKIYLQTPNLTSSDVIDALQRATARGVDVTIVTSKEMMVLEQILTAGTTTRWCLQSFIKQYKRRKDHFIRSAGRSNNQDPNDMPDLEAQLPRLGSLEIFYFRPLPDNRQQKVSEEPVHSHLKLLTVDKEHAVLGSGNMDRASWFTSQELGIMFQSNKFVADISNAVSQVLRGRLSLLFSSRD